MRIYVATSWRNRHTDEVIGFLRSIGHNVYDFRAEGFSWAEAGVEGDKPIAAETTTRLLAQPLVRRGFEQDMAALDGCDAVVLVLPAGRSAHLEAGRATGAGKPLVVYQPEREPPELMLSMGQAVVASLEEVGAELAQTSPPAELEVGGTVVKLCPLCSSKVKPLVKRSGSAH